MLKEALLMVLLSVPQPQQFPAVTCKPVKGLSKAFTCSAINTDKFEVPHWIYHTEPSKESYGFTFKNLAQENLFVVLETRFHVIEDDEIPYDGPYYRSLLWVGLCRQGNRDKVMFMPYRENIKPTCETGE